MPKVAGCAGPPPVRGRYRDAVDQRSAFEPPLHRNCILLTECDCLDAKPSGVLPDQT